jgi:hypothetical protein
MVGTLNEAREKENATSNAGKDKPQPTNETKVNGSSEVKGAAGKQAGASR